MHPPWEICLRERETLPGFEELEEIDMGQASTAGGNITYTAALCKSVVYGGLYVPTCRTGYKYTRLVGLGWPGCLFIER